VCLCLCVPDYLCMCTIRMVVVQNNDITYIMRCVCVYCSCVCVYVCVLYVLCVCNT
jgi:hypothetical protein